MALRLIHAGEDDARKNEVISPAEEAKFQNTAVAGFVYVRCHAMPT